VRLNRKANLITANKNPPLRFWPLQPERLATLTVYSMINSPFIFLCARPQTSEH